MPKIEDIEISKLIPNPLNVKKHPKEQIHDLALQIQQEPGFTNPLVIDEDYMIWVGHGRLEAVKSLGWEKIPCIMVHDMSEGEKYRYMIKDNQVNESPWEFENFKVVMEKIDPILFEPFQMEFDALIEGNTKPDPEEWAETFDNEGEVEKDSMQITFNIPIDKHEQFREYLKSLNPNIHIALMRMYEYCQTNLK